MLDTPFLQSSRKDDHIRLALDQYHLHSSEEFKQTQFVHQSLPQINSQSVDLSTDLHHLPLHTPFFINAMTGGSQKAYTINKKLAILARETHLALASGSLSIALKDPFQQDSFTVLRQENPNGLLFANLGANHTVENAKKAVDLLQADALQIHINAPQEILMREGERDFSHWLHNIEQIIRHLDVPVIVKEVGFGMSRQTIQQLKNIGVTRIDLSGRGGTNFAAIEQTRQPLSSPFLFENWGMTPIASLLEAMSTAPELTYIASGGIKNAMDVAKCLALGARAVGLSAFFLNTIEHNSLDDAITLVNDMKTQLINILTLLGTPTIQLLQEKASIIVAPSVQQWCHARNIDWKQWANRS